MQALNTAKGKEGQNGPNLTTEISKSGIFDFPKLAPERSWGNAGMVGHAETCSKHPSACPSHRSLPIHDRGVVPQKSWNFKIIKISEFQNPRNLGILKNIGISKSAKSQNFKIRKISRLNDNMQGCFF